MTQDAREHRLLGDRGNDPERVARTKGTCGHIQTKHAPQEAGPVPVRCSKPTVRWFRFFNVPIALRRAAASNTNISSPAQRRP
jgi:hypothetical protein